MKMFSLLLACATCCLSAVPAVAASDTGSMTVIGKSTDDPDTIRVPYGDLSLANADDAATLQARVKRATRRACDTLYDAAFLSQVWACQDVAWRVAAPQIAAAVARAGSGQQLAARAVVLRFTAR